MATKTTRKPKMSAERAARMAAREIRLAEVFEAIRAGRAYLMTAWGRRNVTGYRDETGWAYTNNTGLTSDDRSFMVCLETILID